MFAGMPKERLVTRKDYLAGVLALALILITTTCSDASREPGSGAATVCIAQYVHHSALDEAREGFLETARATNSRTHIRTYNANGDIQTANTLADQVCAGGCDVIYALATPMAQQVKNRCGGHVPIIFGAITDPISAGLVDSMNRPGGLVTGSSDQWPYTQQMELIALIWGGDTRVGVPFNPGEANTVYAMKAVRSAAKEIGLQLVEVPVTNPTEATRAVELMGGRVDVVYIPADNTAMSAASGIITAARRVDLPVVAGDPGTFSQGADIGLGVSYRSLGKANAKQLEAVLGGENPGDLPIAISDQPELFLNEDSSLPLDSREIEDWHAKARRRAEG